MKIISFFLALFQVAGVTLGVIPVNTDVDYGGTYRPTQYTTNMIPFIVEGQSDYVIVIDEDAGPGVQTAADELQNYLTIISGATLPVVTDTAAPADEEIVVGATNRNSYSGVMWYADSDVEYYIDDFLQGYYGNAAPMVKEYLDYITAKTSYVHVTNTDWADQSTVYTFDAFRLEKIWKKPLAQELTPEERYRAEMLEISWRYTESVCLAGRFNPLNPFRAREQKRLYDDLLSHNIVKLSSMSGGLIPSKDKINFVFSTPQDWR